jgi:hypothetical protein
MKLIFKLMCFIFILFLISCNTATKQKTIIEIPKWVYSGSHDLGKICYVGSSKPHIKGLPYQRALAVSRAIEGIALQKNVKVDVEVEKIMKGDRNNAKTKMMTYSVQTATGQSVSAKITDIWLNPETKEMFIRMCED